MSAFERTLKQHLVAYRIVACRARAVSSGDWYGRDE